MEAIIPVTIIGGSLILFILFIMFYFIMFALLIGGIILWITMLIDAIKRDFPKSDEKTIWIVVLALTGWIGGLIYYFMVKRPADKASKIK